MRRFIGKIILLLILLSSLSFHTVLAEDNYKMDFVMMKNVIQVNRMFLRSDIDNMKEKRNYKEKLGLSTLLVFHSSIADYMQGIFTQNKITIEYAPFIEEIKTLSEYTKAFLDSGKYPFMEEEDAEILSAKINKAIQKNDIDQIVLNLKKINSLCKAFSPENSNDSSGSADSYNAGSINSFYIDEIKINMKYIPPCENFPTGISEDLNEFSGKASINKGYWLSETEVTYELWSSVYEWAVNNGYHFGNFGKKGFGKDVKNMTDQHPVTSINWRDAIVFCNALTEYVNLQSGSRLMIVYHDYQTNQPIKDSRDTNARSCNLAMPKPNATGFRLPTGNEWECAARYIDGKSWLPGGFASGASDDCNNESATMQVAWFWKNSSFETKEVAQKKPNSLGLYDMSGNVWEWCFDRSPGMAMRSARGGSYFGDEKDLRVGDIGVEGPREASNEAGFRLCRTAD